jgi:hypothetical protein
MASAERETSAWTSTRSGRVPSTAGRTATLRKEQRRRVLDVAEATLLHLEDADLVGRTEAVLDGAEEPHAAVPVALEVEDRVDDVLEDARSRDRPLLGDVADQQGGPPRGLRLGDERGRAFAHLGDASRRRRELARVESLDRVDEQEVGRDRLGVREDVLDASLGEDQHRVVAAEAVGAELHLLGRLFPGHVERRAARAGDLAEDLEADRRLSDPRVASEEGHGPGHDAAAEDAVELGEARRRAGVHLGAHLAESDGLRVAPRADRDRGASGGVARFGQALLDDGLPGAAFATAADPLREAGAALLAREDGARASHRPAKEAQLPRRRHHARHHRYAGRRARHATSPAEIRVAGCLSTGRPQAVDRHPMAPLDGPECGMA